MQAPQSRIKCWSHAGRHPQQSWCQKCTRLCSKPLNSMGLLCRLGTATVETLLKDMGIHSMFWLHIKLQPTLRSSTRSRFRIMEYVSRNWLSSLVALPVIIFLISLSSGICSNSDGCLLPTSS